MKVLLVAIVVVAVIAFWWQLKSLQAPEVEGQIAYQSGIRSNQLNTEKFRGGRIVQFSVPKDFKADYLLLSGESPPIGVSATGHGTTFSWQFYTFQEGSTRTALHDELSRVLQPTVDYYNMSNPKIHPFEELEGVYAAMHDIELAKGGNGFLEEGLFVIEGEVMRYRIFTDDLESASTTECRKCIHGIRLAN